MRALVIYESMYGNTRAVAAAIAEGLRASFDVDVVAVGSAQSPVITDADLLVVGGPTHMHGLSRASSRKAAVEAAHRPGGPKLEPEAEGPGLREWLDDLPTGGGEAFAAFDTRLRGIAAFTGRAGLGISSRLRRHGYRQVAPPESFVVDKQNQLVPGELQHAVMWGRRLAESGPWHVSTQPGGRAASG